MPFRVGFLRERLPSRDYLTTQIARCTRDEVVDLEVDTETGQVEVLKIVSAYQGDQLRPGADADRGRRGAWDELGLRDAALRRAEIVKTPMEDGPWGARGIGNHVMVQTAPVTEIVLVPFSLAVYTKLALKANGTVQPTAGGSSAAPLGPF